MQCQDFSLQEVPSHVDALSLIRIPQKNTCMQSVTIQIILQGDSEAFDWPWILAQHFIISVALLIISLLEVNCEFYTAI